MKSSISDFIKNLTNVQSQIVSIILLSFFIAVLFYKPTVNFSTADPKPDIKPFLPEKATIESESIVQVNVGMDIVNFPVFDIVKNTFTVEAIIWFEFDPSLMPLETVNKFSFEKGSIISRSEPEMKLIGKNLFVQYAITLKFTTNLDHRAFPLSDHRLYITLINNHVTPQEMVFKSTSSGLLIEKEIHVEGWKPIATHVETGYLEAKLDTYDTKKSSAHPRVVFMIDFAKGGVRKVFIIMLPLLVIYFISIFTLSIQPSSANRTNILTLAVGSITGLIAYRFVIDRIIPDVAYFTLADHIFNLFLTATFIIFLIDIFVLKSKKSYNSILFFKGIAFLVIQITVMALLVYLLLFWLNH